VHKLDSRNHLFTEHAYSLETKFAAAVLEKLLETGAENLHDHGLVVTFDSVPINVRNTGSAAQEPIELVLVLQLGKLGLNGLEFNCNSLFRLNVFSFVDLSEGAGADFLHQLPVLADS